MECRCRRRLREYHWVLAAAAMQEPTRLSVGFSFCISPSSSSRYWGSATADRRLKGVQPQNVLLSTLKMVDGLEGGVSPVEDERHERLPLPQGDHLQRTRNGTSVHNNYARVVVTPTRATTTRA